MSAIERYAAISWEQNQSGGRVSDPPPRKEDVRVFTWHRLSPAGRSRTRCWRQSEAWWGCFSPWASDRRQQRPATCCAAKTAAQNRAIRHMLMRQLCRFITSVLLNRANMHQKHITGSQSAPVLPGNERCPHICGQTPGRGGWRGTGRPSWGSRMQLLPEASSHLVKDKELITLGESKGKTCRMWGIPPSCPWQMSVRSALPTMNFGLVQISWRAEAVEKANR